MTQRTKGTSRHLTARPTKGALKLMKIAINFAFPDWQVNLSNNDINNSQKLGHENLVIEL